ncbi:MAG: hypothetical protein GX882_07365 [Methanomicrobiales archaeon]|nr:hypothetical protein [Methanomicrobiales archaeon]
MHKNPEDILRQHYTGSIPIRGRWRNLDDIPAFVEASLEKLKAVPG